MTKPLITIGITSFNSVDTLEAAVISALTQDWENIEVIVVDDCSTIETQNLLVKLAIKYPVIRFFNNNVNGGVSVSRNRIIEVANGEFLAFFDDDDVSMKSRIYEQYSRIINYENKFSNGDLVVCHTSRTLIYPLGEVRVESTMGQVEGKKAPSGLAVAKRILLGKPLEDAYGACPTCCQMARLSTYRTLGGFDSSMRRGEDTDFCIRVAEAGGHFVGISRPLVTQTMTLTSDKSLQDEYNIMLKLLRKYRYLIGDDNYYLFCIDWLSVKRSWLECRYITFLFLIVLLFLKSPVFVFTRIYLSLPNIAVNKALSRFHMRGK